MNDKLFKILVIGAIGAGAWYLWNQHQKAVAAAKQPKPATTSGNDIYGEIGSAATGVGRLLGSVSSIFSGSGATRSGSGAAQPSQVTTGEGTHTVTIGGEDYTVDPAAEDMFA